MAVKSQAAAAARADERSGAEARVVPFAEAFRFRVRLGFISCGGMVLQFVGFMAGWDNPEGLSGPLSAVVGGLVTTYATFLPCFVFIFLGAPYIEVLRGNKNLTGALTGITAAAVGVVMNLALVFGAAVIWPRGLAGGADFFALAVSAAAFLALYRFKADVLWVVLAGGALGLAWTLLSA